MRGRLIPLAVSIVGFGPLLEVIKANFEDLLEPSLDIEFISTGVQPV
jgi:hypothetical protein